MNAVETIVRSLFDLADMGRRFAPRGKIELQLEQIWENCGLTVRTKEATLKPHLLNHKKRDYGYDVVLHLPPGLCDMDFYRRYSKIAWALNSELEFEQVNGKLLMRVLSQGLKQKVSFAPPPPPVLMALPVPIGYSRAGLEWLDLADAPHLLIAGITKGGKSNLLHVLCAALAHVNLCIIDLKRLEFSYLRQSALVATNEKEAAKVLVGLNREMEKRMTTLETAGCVKIQDYNAQGGAMSYMVLVIDELAELQDDTSLALLNRLLRLARACGISIVAATQRPSTKVIDGDSRGQFGARICFRMACEIDSRMILGENCSRAAYLPTIPGRAIFKFDKIREVQTMLHPASESKQRSTQCLVPTP